MKYTKKLAQSTLDKNREMIERIPQEDYLTQHLIKDAKRRRKQLEEPTWPYYLALGLVAVALAIIIAVEDCLLGCNESDPLDDAKTYINQILQSLKQTKDI